MQQRSRYPARRPPQASTPHSSSSSSLVQTNCFAIRRLPRKEYYQYTVAFEPDVKDFRKRQEIMNKLRVEAAATLFHSHPIYDGTNLLYTSAQLQLHSSGTGKYLIAMGNAPPAEGARGTYRVTITKTLGEPIRPWEIEPFLKTASSGATMPQKAIQVTNLLQLLIKQEPNQKYPHNQRAYFTSDGKMQVRGGLELWRGYFQSVRPSIGRMLVNVDTSMCAVYQRGELIDVAMAFMGSRNIRDLDMSRTSERFLKLERFLRNVKITVRNSKRNRDKVIRGLEPNAGNYRFTLDNGTELTVAEYTLTRHNIKVKYPSIVGVRLSGRNADHPEIVPFESCVVKPDQLYKKQLPEELTRDAVQFATLKPHERLKHIAQSENSPVRSYTTSEYVVESGMQIDTDPVAIQGKIIGTPAVMFGGDQVSPRAGAWNVLNQRLNKPANFVNWAAITFTPRVPGAKLESLMQELARACRTLGMNVQPACTIQEGSPQNTENSLDKLCARVKEAGKFHPDLLIVVVLPQNAADLRARVKYWGDIQRGIRTQCLREGRMDRPNNQYWNNVVLKINARLGGKNFVAKSQSMTNCFTEPTIIMGADVGHAAPGAQKPSVAGLVWSTDRDATVFSGITRVQQPRLEQIADLELMAKIAILDSFMKINKVPPARVIFFRDGLSEGEYEKVAAEEITAIENVWKSRNVPKPPKLTYIVVGKGHHIAFFPGNNAPSNDNKGNCVAGFVTDNELASPLATDFYLMSHSAILGTSRSSHYIVIKDDNQIPLSALQELAFSLCHVYAKATRSVSIPAPVYYADLACGRTAFHLSPESNIRFSDSSTVASGGSTFDLAPWEKEYRHINANMQQSMYFL